MLHLVQAAIRLRYVDGVATGLREWPFSNFMSQLLEAAILIYEIMRVRCRYQDMSGCFLSEHKMASVSYTARLRCHGSLRSLT